MKKHRYILLLLICCLSFTMKAQYTTDYVPMKYSSSGYKMSESAFNKKMKVKYNTIDQGMIKKFNKFLYVLYRTYANGSKDKQFIEEPWVKKYLKAIVDSIALKNNLKEKFEVVCTRYVVPNAFNMGDYKLYVNIGILEQMKNESQIAFMLAHELSHQLLFHVQDNFIAQEKLAKDKVVKKEIRDINRAKYNKLDKAFQFIKNYNYDFAKYSRANEKSADSMAVILIQHTDYDLREGKTLMEILDHSDEDSTLINYNNYLDNNTKTLLPEWYAPKKSTLTFGKKSEYELDKDSSKTHPDIPLRIKMIDTLINLAKYEAGNKKVFVQSKAAFDSLTIASKFEIVEVYMKRKRYGAVVYYGIRLLATYPENKYLYKNVAIALNELNKAVKKHTVQNFIPIESEEDFSEGYNQFLRIIDRTTADEFDKLVRNFVNQFYPKMSSYPEIQSIYDGFNKK